MRKLIESTFVSLGGDVGAPPALPYPRLTWRNGPVSACSPAIGSPGQSAADVR
ncbi:MAG TPA: hypothetical protein VLM11_09955 [Streptosporangiaceae bacterium]|nr:hypothetical protein [Streptosporangiaceae bacterium]